MAVIVYTDRGGVRAYLRSSGGFSENPADALVFTDATAANTYLAANPQSQPTGQLTVTGLRHYGKRSVNE